MTAWYVADAGMLLVTGAAHVVPVPQDADPTTAPPLVRITMKYGVGPTFWLTVAVRVTEVPAITVVALAPSVTVQGSNIWALMPVTSDVPTATSVAQAGSAATV